MTAKKKETSPPLPELEPLQLYVRTDTNTYVVRIPTGDIGWIHFSIIMEAEHEKEAGSIYESRLNPDTNEYEDVRIPSRREHEIMKDSMTKWIKEVMPHIMVSHEWTQVPWFDIMPIFNAVTTNASIDTTNFRSVQDT